MKSEKLSIIIYSCLKNFDMWEVFSQLFRKYWPDCIYKVILVTDQALADMSTYVFDEIVELDATWDRMIKKAITTAKTPYVMLFMDDYLICDYVDNKIIEQKIKLAIKYQADNIRLIEAEKAKGYFSKDDSLMYFVNGSAYCYSLQAGIWRSSFLIQNVKKGWSAWDFERIGSLEASRKKIRLLATADYIFPYEEGVRQGRWMDSGIKLCSRNNIPLDFGKRKPMGNWGMAKIYLKGLILDINPTLIIKIQNTVNRVLKK